MRLMMATALAGLLAASALQAAKPVRISDAKDQQILEGYLKHVAGVPKYITPDRCRKQAAESAEGYTWTILPQLDMTLTAYKLTGDAKYLDLFVQTFEAMRSAMTKGPDGYLGWYGKALSTFQDPANPDRKVDVIINAYRTTDVVAQFIEAIDRQPALRRKYESKRAEYLDLLENHLARKWVERGSYVDLGAGGAIFRTHPGLKDVKGSLTEPHNKHSIIIRAMLSLYRVTGKDEYMRMAVKLGTRYKRCLRLKDGHYEWNYWDPAGAWDKNPGDSKKWKHWMGVEHKGGYYSSSLSQAVALYHHGVVFDREDIERFVKTQVGMAWNGSLDDPKWARCDGTTSAKYMQGSYMCAALAPLEKKVYRFVYTGPRQDERVKSATHSWQGGPVANGWLAGKYVTCPAARDGKPAHAEVGKRFLAKGENRRFAESLAFRVTGSGYDPPEVPARMKPMPADPPWKYPGSR